MKKSSFVAMILGTVSGVLFALGMCMALVEEWNQLTSGVILGTAGLALGLITLLVWRRMEHKAPVRISAKMVIRVIYGVVSAIVFGIGLCLCLIGGSYVLGSVIGLVGIVMLLSLIPIIKALK